MNGKKGWILVGILAIFLLVISGLMVVFGIDSNDAVVYFPLKPGNVWTYRLSVVGVTNSITQKLKVTEPENGNPKVVIYDSQNKPQFFLNYVINEKGLYKVKLMGVSGLFEYQPIWQVLSSKLNKGAIWSWESSDHKMKETAKVLASQKITVPAGSFNTILIQFEGIDEEGMAYVEKTWYAKGVGYVKDEYQSDGQTVVSELTEYKLAK